MFAFRPAAVALVLASSCYAAASAAPPAGARLTVPDDTLVSVQLVAPVSSTDNHVGDVFDVRTAEAVNVGGYVIVANNAKGRGHVTKIDPAGGHGHAGSVEVVVDYVFAVDGEKIKLKDKPLVQEGSKAHGGATVAGIFTYGLASNAVKGGDATINTTRTLETHIDGTIHIVSSEKAAGPNSDAGFAH